MSIIRSVAVSFFVGQAAVMCSYADSLKQLGFDEAGISSETRDSEPATRPSKQKISYEPKEERQMRHELNQPVYHGFLDPFFGGMMGMGGMMYGEGPMMYGDEGGMMYGEGPMMYGDEGGMMYGEGPMMYDDEAGMMYGLGGDMMYGDPGIMYDDSGDTTYGAEDATMREADDGVPGDYDPVGGISPAGGYDPYFMPRMTGKKQLEKDYIEQHQ